METLYIKPVNNSLGEALQHKIDFKIKPVGSLGKLEETAIKVGLIQDTLSPELKNPHFFVFAGDHGITEEKITPYPQEVTHQMVLNFLTGGAAINIFAKQNNIDLQVIDAGVNHDFDGLPGLLSEKVRKGTRNFAKEPAMTTEECQKAMDSGARLVNEAYQKGCNIVGFGEMGIGNTTSASALMAAYCNIAPSKCVGAGTGLDNEGIRHKAKVIEEALALHDNKKSPLNILATFGGYEIAMTTGAMLQAAANGMIILVDGFIITSALLAAHAINPTVLDYALFSHCSDENGHRLMLDFLKGEALLDLNLRLGEGTGAALAYPLVQSAVNFLNQMNSFEEAGVSNKEEENA